METERQEAGPENEGQERTHSHHHHEHHTHHHTHHHSGRKKKRRGSNKVWAFLSEHKAQLAGVVVAIGLLIFLVVLIFQETAASREAQGRLPDVTGQTTPPPTQTLEWSPLTLRLPWLPEEVALTAEPVRILMTQDDTQTLEDPLAAFREENDRLDVGLCMELAFDVESLPLGQRLDRSRVELWPEDAPEEKLTYEMSAGKRRLFLTGLRTGTTYRYQITLFLSGGTEHTLGGDFRTAASPRILSVAGLRNVRDLGGWTTADGSTLRQGLLYRGSEMDGAVVDHLKITEVGTEELLSQFKIRTDLDLRDPGTGINALGGNVRHTCISVPAYGGIFSHEGKELVGQVFAELADEDSYPVYLHDTYGVDRTGTVCYLLQALLGVEEEDLRREARLSALAYETLDLAGLDDLEEVLMTYGGRDLQESVELFLLNAGVDRQQIQSIRQIWLY